MYAHIETGDRMAGLMAYLAGPGRAGEHTRPHLVAGDELMMSWYGEAALSAGDAQAIARHLDRPRTAHGQRVQVPAKRYQETGREAGGVRVMEKVEAGVKDAHVWHCSLALRAEEGQLGDEAWGRIAAVFVDRMGLGPQVDDAGEEIAPGCRWVAVHHGVSTKGNDHVHLAVNLVREDGTIAETHRDYARARDLCRELEVEFGLLPLHPNDFELARSAARAEWEQTRLAGAEVGPAGMPWDELDEAAQEQHIAAQFDTPADFEAARSARERPAAGEDLVQENVSAGELNAEAQRLARGRFEQARRDGEEERTWWALPRGERDALVAAAKPEAQSRWALTRTVRACAAAAAHEGEFVHGLRDQGLLVRPYYAKKQPGQQPGQRPEVAGYSVARRPEVKGERPIWKGGGTLAKDLTLPRLRSGWVDEHGQPDEATGEVIAAEWEAARRHKPPAARPTAQIGSEADWRAAAADLAQIRTQLASVPAEDRHAWAWAARQASGVLAAWSQRTEARPGPLSAAAEALAKSASIRDAGTSPARTKMPSAAGTALLMLAAAKPGPAAYALVLRELLGLAQAIHRMQRVSAAARAARELETVVRGQLGQVASRVNAEVQHQREVAAAQSERGRGQEGPYAPIGSPRPAWASGEGPQAPRPPRPGPRPGREAGPER